MAGAESNDGAQRVGVGWRLCLWLAAAWCGAAVMAMAEKLILRGDQMLTVTSPELQYGP